MVFAKASIPVAILLSLYLGIKQTPVTPTIIFRGTLHDVLSYLGHQRYHVYLDTLIPMNTLLLLFGHFTNLPANPVLIVNGKLIWIAVLNGGLSSEFSTHITGLHRGKKEEEMGRWSVAGRIVAGTAQ